MTEFSPFPNERMDIPKWFEWDNVLSSPEWEIVCDSARELEADMILEDESASEETLQDMAERTYELGEKLGASYYRQQCRVVGRLYTDDDHSGSDIARTMRFNTTKFRFGGPTFRCLDNRWRVVFELYRQPLNGQIPREFYYTPLLNHHLTDLRVKPGQESDNDEENVVALLGRHVEGASQFVQSADFEARTAERQREWLLQVVDDVDCYVPSRLRDIDVVVSCTEYYTMYDDMPGILLPGGTLDPFDDTPIEEQATLKGMIDCFKYPEMEDMPSDTHLTSADFTVNGGASCMLLRNTEDSVTYYVLPQSVSAID